MKSNTTLYQYTWKEVGNYIHETIQKDNNKWEVGYKWRAIKINIVRLQYTDGGKEQGQKVIIPPPHPQRLRKESPTPYFPTPRPLASTI